MPPNAPAATKLPDLGPGGFRFVTKALTGETPDGGPRRFRAIASSTITDMKGDTISLKAMRELAADFKAGLPIFMDHNYSNVVDAVFGQSDQADIFDSGERDTRTGAPIYDLVIGGIVNEPNPRAIQLHDSIKGGFVKFGVSIGAIVRKHAKDKETGGMLIDSLAGKEASIVGIPMNQRSWTYKAASAAASLDTEAVDEMVAEEEGAAEEVEVQAAINENTTITNGIMTTTFTNAANTTTASVGEAGPEVVTIIKGACPTCNHAAGCDCADCDCGAAMHGTAKSVSDPSELEDAGATTPVVTPDGQDSEADTPETASAADGEQSDPAETQKDMRLVDAGDMSTLVEQLGLLIKTLGQRDETIAALTTERDEARRELSEVKGEVGEAKQVIEKALSLPLQRKAVGALSDFTDRFPMFDPRITQYLNRGEESNQ